MYEEGKGVKQDDFKALKFFQKACDLNDGSGCSNLGLINHCHHLNHTPFGKT
jgi:TPR repeat protein